MENNNRLESLPTNSKQYRRNVYNRSNYVLYGDKIITEYIYEEPFEYWNIDVDWTKP